MFTKENEYNVKKTLSLLLLELVVYNITNICTMVRNNLLKCKMFG